MKKKTKRATSYLKIKQKFYGQVDNNV